MRLMDADAHVMEPGTLWRDGTAASFALQAPAPVLMEYHDSPLSLESDAELLARFKLACGAAGLSPTEMMTSIEDHQVSLRNLHWNGEPVWRDIPDGLWQRGAIGTIIHHLDSLKQGFNPTSTMEALSRQGVERAWMYPTAGLWVLAIEAMPAPLAAALAEAYNDWIVAYCSAHPDFLRPVGTVALHDPTTTVAAVHKLVARGVRAVTVRPNPFHGRTLGNPELEPFWQACADLNVSVAVHEGTHARVQTTGADRFHTRFARHASSHPLEQQLALLSILEAGILHRHPRLRVAFLEAGCGWLPSWLWRLDHLEYGQLRWEVQHNMPEPPSYYVRRQCFFGVEPDEPGIEDVVNMLGSKVLLYGSDHPHVDHPPQVQHDARTLQRRLGERAAQQVLWSNPARFYDEAPPA